MGGKGANQMNGSLIGSCQFYWVLPSFAEFYRVLPSFDAALPNFHEFDLVGPSFNGIFSNGTKNQ